METGANPQRGGGLRPVGGAGRLALSEVRESNQVFIVPKSNIFYPLTAEQTVILFRACG